MKRIQKLAILSTVSLACLTGAALAQYPSGTDVALEAMARARAEKERNDHRFAAARPTGKSAPNAGAAGTGSRERTAPRSHQLNRYTAPPSRRRGGSDRRRRLSPEIWRPLASVPRRHLGAARFTGQCALS